MTEYQLRTIKTARKRCARFATATDTELARLYTRWSMETASVAWHDCTSENINAFVAWATTAPIDRK